MQYFALSAILIFCGYVLPRVAAQKLDLQPEASSPMLNGPIEAVSEEVDGSRQETEDTDLRNGDLKKGSRNDPCRQEEGINNED